MRLASMKQLGSSLQTIFIEREGGIHVHEFQIHYRTEATLSRQGWAESTITLTRLPGRCSHCIGLTRLVLRHFYDAGSRGGQLEQTPLKQWRT